MNTKLDGIMETLRKNNKALFALLDRVATSQHEQLLSSFLEQLTPYTKSTPKLHLMPNAFERMKAHAEAVVDLEMRGKTPEPLDFGGYTLVVKLTTDEPFNTLYLTRPFSNKLKLTAFTAQPPIFPFALWITLNPTHPGITPEGFNPQGAFAVFRGPAPTLLGHLTNPNDLITAGVF